MTRWPRFAWIALRALGRARLRPTETSTIVARVWPTDVDLTATNNAAYLIYFEMGRLDLQLRTGMARLAARRGWAAPLAAIHVQFQRPLRRFQRFRVSTRLAFWDERWLFLEQRIDRAGETVATAISKSVVIGREGRVAPADVAAELGSPLGTAVPSETVALLDGADRAMRERAEAWERAAPRK
jgi:acyl-CoA thioesterase FadM